MWRSDKKKGYLGRPGSIFEQIAGNPSLLRHVQQAVKEQIEYLTGFYLDRVDITAKRLYLDEEEVPEAKEN